MKKTKSMVMGAAILAALALPMVAGAANKLVVNGTDGTTPKMVVTDTGYVGVGNSSPTGPLHINSSNFTPFSAGVTNAIRIEGNEVTNGAGFGAYNIRSNGAVPQVNDRLGFIFFGSNMSGTLYNPAGFFAKVDEIWTGTSTPAYFDFLTTPSGSTTRNVRMRIASNGNVGLGGSGTNGINATQRLEVEGGVRLNPTSSVKPTCGTTYSGTVWFTSGATDDVIEVCAKKSGTYAWRSISLP